MSWAAPALQPVINSSLLLSLSLLLSSICYRKLTEKRRLDKSIMIAMALSLVAIIILSLLCLMIFPQIQLCRLALIYLVIVVLVSIEQYLFLMRIRTSHAEFVLDGVRFHIYTGSDINAFYHRLIGAMYVHQDLLKVLTPDELKAIALHEMGHHFRLTKTSTSMLFLLTIFAISLWLFGGLVLIAIAGHLFSTLLLLLIFGQHLSEVLESLILLISLHLILSSVSLILTSIAWIWEQDADFYASERVGANTYAIALIKTYTARRLSMESRYARLKECTVSFSLDSVPPLTLLDIAKEMLLQALPPRGFIEAITKPLVRTHPPLYLRLRALQTSHVTKPT